MVTGFPAIFPTSVRMRTGIVGASDTDQEKSLFPIVANSKKIDNIVFSSQIAKGIMGIGFQNTLSGRVTMQATIPAQRLDYYDACHKQQQEFCAAQKQKHNRPPLQRVVRNKRNQPVGLTIAFLDDGGNLMIGWSRVNRGYRNVETRRGEQVRTRRVAVGDEWNYAVGFRRAIDHARPAATMPEWIEARDDHGRRIVPDSIADAVKLMSAKASEVYKVLNIKVCRAQAVIKGSDTIIEPTKQPVALTDAINAIYEEAANAAQAIAPTAENREATKQNKQVARARRRRMYLTADGKTWIPVRLSLPPINKIAEITARRAAKRSAP